MTVAGEAQHNETLSQNTAENFSEKFAEWKNLSPEEIHKLA